MHVVHVQTPHVIAREALSSAAVLLGSACLLPAVPPAMLAARIASGLWQHSTNLTQQRPKSFEGAWQQQDGSSPSNNLGIAEAALMARGTSLSAELSRLGPLSRVCALKGWLSMLPRSALCAPLPAVDFSEATSIWAPAAEAGSERINTGESVSADKQSMPGAHQTEGSAGCADGSQECREAYQSGHADELSVGSRGESEGGAVDGCESGLHREGQWCFLVDGALPFACTAIASAPDAHSKFHAVALLTMCLQRVKDCLEVSSSAFPVIVGPCQVEILPQTHSHRLMHRACPDVGYSYGGVCHCEGVNCGHVCLQDAARSYRATSQAPGSQAHSSNKPQTAHPVISNGREHEPDSDTDDSTCSEQDQTSALGAGKYSTALEDPSSLLVPLLGSQARSRVMSILWANWEVRVVFNVVKIFVRRVLCAKSCSSLKRAKDALQQVLNGMQICLQEPLQQTVKQIHASFDALLDIEEVQQEQAAALGLSAQAGAATQAFLEDTAREIMNAGG
jgi:hypothetical protein